MTDLPQGIPTGIHWLSDEDYAKSVGQLRLQLNGVFKPLELYGQQPYCQEAINQIVKLAEDFGLRVRGVNKIISLERVQRKNGHHID